MATFGDMKTRIASEMDRSDLTAFIANAITDAIAEYGTQRFWFNESRNLTFNTVAAQREYTVSDAAWIGTVLEIDALFVTVGGQNRCMTKRSPEELELLADNSAMSGEPYCWSYFDSAIQLYAIPDQVYPVRAMAHYRLSDLSDDNDTNAWTTEAERLIRRRAKQLLWAEVVKSKNDALAEQPLIEQALNDLDAETSRRKTLGRIQGTQF